MVNPFLEEKKGRIEQSKSIISGINGSKLSKVVATLAINLGIKQKTAMEYVKTLLNFEFIEKRAGRIYIKEDAHPPSPDKESG